MARVTSTQKLPMVFFSWRAKPRISAIAIAMPGRRRSEVLHRERGHLHEIAHGRFAGVGLPVRVRDEAGGRVEGQVRADVAGAEVLRIERQEALQLAGAGKSSRKPKMLKLSSAAV